MPELPEVETIRRDLSRILNKEILECKLMDKKVADISIKKIVGCFFISINRIGKLLYFKLSSGDYLLIHLKMTGQLLYKSFSNNNTIVGGHEDKAMDILELPNRHTRVAIKLREAGHLYFNDLRRFGYIRIVNKEELGIIKSKFGIEPLKKEFRVEKLVSIFRNRKANIKSLLLNQNLIAGIGNIYADEILFRSGVRPTRMGGELSLKEIKRIHNATNFIIKKAINNRGTTFKDFRDTRGKKGNFSSMLKVFGRQGKECYKCNYRIIKIKLGGRGTHYCFKCQK